MHEKLILNYTYTKYKATKERCIILIITIIKNIFSCDLFSTKVLLVIIVSFTSLYITVIVVKVFTNSKLNTLVDEVCFSRGYPMNNNDTEKLHMLTTILNENIGVIV